MRFPSIVVKPATLLLVVSPLGSMSARAADAAAGATVFKQKCMACHTITPGAKGLMAPNLSGLANRPAAATVFAYSTALKNSKLKWDSPTLTTFLTGPSQMVPGTRMIVNVPDAVKRADLVAYLMTLKK